MSGPASVAGVTSGASGSSSTVAPPPGFGYVVSSGSLTTPRSSYVPGTYEVMYPRPDLGPGMDVQDLLAKRARLDHAIASLVSLTSFYFCSILWVL